MKYIFANMRGKDFESEGASPLIAYENLCITEKDNGSLWKISDKIRNHNAVYFQGFEYLELPSGSRVAYKQID